MSAFENICMHACMWILALHVCVGLCLCVTTLYAQVVCVPLMRTKTHKWKTARGVIEVADILRLLKAKANRQHHVSESRLVHV